MGNKRQEQILFILSKKQDWVTGKQLGNILQVSDRTIRSDVKVINEESSVPIIESNVRRGYKIYQNNSAAAKLSQEVRIPQTPGARRTYIIQKLLFAVKEINLTKLQGQIYVSGFSIENDLKRIRKMLEPYPGLDLIRNKECISLKGDEISKRKLYKDLLVVEVQENFLNLNQLANLFKNFDLIEVKDIFEEVLQEYEYSIHESLFPMLILNAGIGIERMLHSHYIGIEDSGSKLDETTEYQIAHSIFEKVANRLHIPIKKGEIRMFALVLMGRHSADYVCDLVSFNGKWLNTQAIVREVLSRLYELFGVDFREDENLVEGMKMHIHGLIEREKNNINLENIFLGEIKQKYPLVFEMGICAAEFLAEQLGLGVSDTESGYIALHLGAASERMNTRRKFRAVAILPYSQVISDMCVKKISETFHDRLEIVKTLRFFEEKEIAALEPDLLLTTCHITHSLNVVTIPINLFVDSDTESNILQAMNKMDKKRFHQEFNTHIGDLIRKQFYFQDLECGTPEEVIRFLCSELEQGGVVDSEFVEIVFKREEMSPTSFVNAFAIPHAFGVSAKKPTIVVAQLKNAIQWGNNEVKLVMLFAIHNRDYRIIKMFFDWISSVVNNHEQVAELCRTHEYEQFIELITA